MISRHENEIYLEPLRSIVAYSHPSHQAPISTAPVSNTMDLAAFLRRLARSMLIGWKDIESRDRGVHSLLNVEPALGRLHSGSGDGPNLPHMQWAMGWEQIIEAALQPTYLEGEREEGRVCCTVSSTFGFWQRLARPRTPPI